TASGTSLARVPFGSFFPFGPVCNRESIQKVDRTMSTALKKENEFPNLQEVPRLPALQPTAETSSQLFFNRELSLLEFHRRVLEEGFDESNPILERLRYLSIFSANLDEFFSIRVS